MPTLKELMGTTPRRMALTAALGLLVAAGVVFRGEMQKHEAEGMLIEQRKIAAERLNAALLKSEDPHSIAVLASLAVLQEQVHAGRWSDESLSEILKMLKDTRANRIVRVRALSTLALPLSEGRFTDAQKEQAKAAVRLCLEDAHWIIRYKACGMAARLRDMEATERLRKLRTDERSEVRVAAGRALAGLGEG